MEREHAERMVDCLTVDESEAAQALEHGRLVYAVETPEGEWGEVERIDEFTAFGRKVPSFSVEFVGGGRRVFQPGGTFWVERDRKVWEA